MTTTQLAEAVVTNELIARILQCPDCNGTLGTDLLCTGCGRSFVPADDGIISALPSDLQRPDTNKEQLQALIDAGGAPDTQTQNIVLYERAFHDEQAAYYDRLFADPLPLQDYYRHLVRDQIYDCLRNVPFIVDLCCGTGKSSAPLIDRGLTVIGIDVSREMLRVYRKKSGGKPNPILIHADASRPPLRKNSCVAVSMIGGLHHIPDQAGSLQCCCDALADGGLLILHEPLKTGQVSTLARLVENLYAVTDPVRVWGALRRRLGLRSRQRSAANATQAAAPADFTPYEHPFTSADELLAELPRNMRTVLLRSQGGLSFRQFPPYLQTRFGHPLAAAIVRLDDWISRTRRSDWSGDALFGVFRKELC